jgi:hypothetical protein
LAVALASILATMEDKAYIQFKCYIHELPLDGTWQCPDRGCRAAHCPICGRYEKDRCEHLFYTDGEWIYYAPDGLTSEDFPGEAFEELDFAVVLDAFEDPGLARRLHGGEDPLRVLCTMAMEGVTTPTLTSYAGGWGPGTDSWSNTWVANMPEALSNLQTLVVAYHKGLERLTEAGAFDFEEE